ncbi:pentatricopeptide repeat protein [Dactylonectria estremocensis]|uniref:Pentatricopeptide repeat protein n=1 Tax=Dactylonectria estremocensis TaxID=1079267 RepID=A0A9P9FED6_9HYPO|nr:pentatricopeptide repeat protein [Dactylonectria estremocensis]
MRRATLLYDGLWRCLCPAFDVNALPRALNASILSRTSCPSSSRSRSVPNTSIIQRRRHGTSSLDHQDSPPNVTSIDSFFQIAEKKLTRVPAKKDPYSILGRLIPPLETVPSEAIIHALKVLRNGNYTMLPNPHERIVLFVKFLITKRKHPLDAFIYECMMDAMADPQGSALGVRNLLRDMTSQGIMPTAAICYSALEALTVHPDYVLRQEVVEIMTKYWHEMTLSAKQNIAIGMLRDGQHELALAKLTDLHEDGVQIDLWVYDIFIVEFGRIGFLDEMLQLLRQRKYAKGTDDAFRTLLLHALDLFSQAYHKAGTKFVWDYVVAQPILNPPNAILENILGTAARHGDTKLSTEALGTLSSRGRVPDHQYEALVDTFAAAEDMPGALGVLAIMERNGANIQRGATRQIYQAMKKNPWLIQEANTTLEEMRKNGVIPLEAIEVTIEATAQIRGSEAAMPLYHETFALSGKRPGHSFLKELILHAAQPETMWALAKDYGVMVPKDRQLQDDDLQLYDRMIPACAEAGDFDRAFEYAQRVIDAENAATEAEESEEEGNDNKRWLHHAWVQPLVDHAVAAKDHRVWPIVDLLVKSSDEKAVMVQMMLQRHRMDRKIEVLKAQKDDQT